MFDKRTFSRLSLVGTHVIKSIDQFIVKDGDTSAQSDSSPQMGSSPSPTGESMYGLAKAPSGAFPAFQCFTLKF